MSSNSLASSIKHEIKENLSLSIPLISAQLVYACSSFVGTAMVAKLGEDALAASVLVSMIWMSLTVLFFGLLNSISVLVSHQYGAKNNAAITDIMGQSFILGGMLMIGIVLIFLTVPFFLNLTTQPPEVLMLARQYVYALLWEIPGLIVLVIFEQFLAGINRGKLVLRISLLIVPIEIPIIYAFIFGKFGLPACGVAGVGYGFTVSYTLSAIVLGWYLYKSSHYCHFKIYSKITNMNLSYLKELIRVGLPIGFMHVVELSAFTLITFWIARFGTTLLAAHQIIIQYVHFFIAIVFAMSQAVTVRVGHSVGRNDLAAVRYAAYVGMILNLISIFLIVFAFKYFPDFFIGFDIDITLPENAQLINDARMLLLIGGILLIFDNVRIVGFGALRGLKDTKFPLYASVISFWLIGLTCAYLLGFYYDWRAQGIWWGMTFGIACGAAIVLMRLNYILKRVDLSKIMMNQSMQ